MKSKVRINELVFVSEIARQLEKELPNFLFGENLNPKKIFRGVWTDVKPNMNIIDIGCDHGWIGISAIKNKIGTNVVFSDISAFSLEKAVDKARTNGISDVSDFRVGDGLEVLRNNEKFGIGFLAGVGGHKIVEILSNGEKANKVDWWVLQTATDDENVREYLRNTGYFILYDKMVFEFGKTYHTFLATKVNFVTNDIIEKCERFVLEFCINHGKAYNGILESGIKKYLKFESRYYGKQNFFSTGKNFYNMVCWHVDKLNQKLNDINYLIEHKRENNDSASEYKSKLKVKIKDLKAITQSIREYQNKPLD